MNLYRSDPKGNSDVATLVATYRYDPWGKVQGIFKPNGEKIPETAVHVAAYNPFRYRGYRYDGDTGFYYLQSRYYDPEICRFISADDYTSTGQGILGYNTFAYCGDNPVMRQDNSGNSWLVCIGIGLATQYFWDVIENINDGKTGIDAFKPSSSIGEYIAAGVTAVIPGKGLGGALVRNVVAEGIIFIEKGMSGEKVDIAESIVNIGCGTILDVGFEKASDVVDDFIRSKMPRNYSSFAHTELQSNPNLTRNQIHRNMQRSIRFNRAAAKVASVVISAARSCLPY